MPKEPSFIEPQDRRFELLVKAITAYAIYMLDLDGRVTSWNAGAERLTGYREPEILGQSFARFLTPEDRARGKPELALKTAAGEGHWEDEAWRVRKDGTWFWALAVLDAIRDESGRLIGFAKITRDMSERRAAQLALAESERRFRLLVSSVVDYALFTLNLQGFIQSWNPGAERLKGYSASEIIGRHFSVFYTPEARIAGGPEKVLNEARIKGRFEGEGWRVRKDGSWFWANVVIDPIYDESGTLVGFTKITRDITERRALEQMKEQLYQSQKMELIGQITGGVAHDFNNLLTAVGGSLSLVAQGAVDPRALKLIETAQHAVARGAKLVGQLLAFARQHRLELETSNANALISAFEALLRHAVGESIVLRLDLDQRLWLAAIDQTQFQSAVLNLVVNSRDAIEGSGTIRIETRNVAVDAERAQTLTEISPGDYIMIAVHDTGSGMSAETKAKAIEPFFTTKEVGKGSGLGLSQVYGFARQSNGQIEIESALGQGTTVRLFLPRVRDESPATEKPAEAKTLGTVLVVEDDPDVLAIAVEAVHALGYEVYSASHAAEALIILRRDMPIDVLFTDVVMPSGMNGIELAAEARRLRPAIRVLLASGYTRMPIEPGPDMDFISKPYQFQDLARKLEILLLSPAQL